jgi:hypothetical protein
LPRDRCPDAGQVGPALQQGQAQGDHADERGQRVDDEGVAPEGGDTRHGTAQGLRCDERPYREEGGERRDQRRGPGQEDRLDDAHHGQVRRRGAAGPEERRLRPAPVREHAGHQDDRVQRKDRVLDHEEEDAGSADEHGTVHAGEDLGQARCDLELAVDRQDEPDPGVELLGGRPHRRHVIHTEAAGVRQASPFV